jgi:hypothetical protein
MPGATLAEIRAGLETQLAQIPNVTTSAYMLDSPPDLTLQVMGPDRINWDLALHRGLDSWTFIVQGFSGSPESQAAQINLDNWLSPSGTDSVKAAIEADGTLGGVVVNSHVVESSGYRIYDLPNRGRTLGAEWSVEVFNTGT